MLVTDLPAPELRGYENVSNGAGQLAAVDESQADLVVAIDRPRSFLGELFHYSVTA